LTCVGFRRRRAASVYTLIETCKLDQVDPHAWLAFVLAKLPDHLAKRIDKLLPWNWKAARDSAAAASKPIAAA
jgi:transposase